MNTLRDSLLTLGVRQRNWIRLEHWKRASSVSQIIQRVVLNSLEADHGLSRVQKTHVRSLRAALTQRGSQTKHTTRCRLSGRSHQALRDIQLSRMQSKQLMWEGRLLSFRLGRR